ncbi:HK97 family phage prohead protease [Pseudonocardia hispaniensis]|uniref:HK97 family phage prohead protease n=1 Tax=Pseudonocardia hispaniensis TaxID=904933 RepID=A0ABW1IX35_9PSEU
MNRKTCPVTIKAAGEQDGTEDGVFEALVATWDVDSVGDRIVKGAFADTLAEWKASGNPIPVLWSHMSHDPDYHIGVVEDAEERDDGLWVKGRLDIEDPRSKSAQVYRLLKGRRVTQFSFAYDVLDGAPGKDADGSGRDVFELRKLKLYEVGPTLIGANQRTELLEVKQQPVTVNVHPTRPATDAAEAEVKVGRTLSAANEKRVRQIAQLAQELLDALDSGADGDGKTSATTDAKATPAPPAAPEEPRGANGAEPARHGTASLRLRTDLALFAAEVDSLTN